MRGSTGPITILSPMVKALCRSLVMMILLVFLVVVLMLLLMLVIYLGWMLASGAFISISC